VPADELILNLLFYFSTLCIIPSMTVELQVPEDLANSLCKRKSICLMHCCLDQREKTNKDA